MSRPIARRAGTRWLAPWVGALAGLLTGCAPAGGGWDWRTVERDHPELAAIDGQRLRDAIPYPRPVLDQGPPRLDLFLCRWPDGHRIRVALPEEADADQRAMLRIALRAWEESGIGLRFEVGEAPADIELRFVQHGDGSAWPRTAVTAADCRVGAGRGPLQRARIWLDRANLDGLGRPQPLGPAEFTGAVLHELAHGLGFQGHIAVGESVAVREVEKVRRAGARVLSGEPFEEPSVAALYALPQGTPVGSIALDDEAARWLRALLSLPIEDGWTGPYARVGDHSARIFWQTARGGELGVTLRDWPEAVADPERLRLAPDVGLWRRIGKRR